jgi:hypothetical protein
MAVPLIVFELALIGPPIRVSVLPLTVHAAILPLTLIVPPIRPLVSSHSMEKILLELTLIALIRGAEVLVGFVTHPSEFAIILHSVVECSNIGGSICPGLFSHPMGSVIEEVPVIYMTL